MHERGSVDWYAREELAGTWRIAACPAHGRELERHRFHHLGRQVEAHGRVLRSADECAVCRRPDMLGEVERCTCEVDTARCPEHQNLGCGG